MLVNGQHQHDIPVADRAVQYGDGAFETILIRNHLPVFWQAHIDRLSATCRILKISADFSPLRAEVEALIATHGANGVVKVIISRGEGGRGYSAPPSPLPTRIVQFHPLPQNYAHFAQEGISAFKCQHPLSSNTKLAGLKHLNRLDQVLASLEIPSYAQEGLMCNESGDLIEGIKSNIFLVSADAVLTPELDRCGVAGVMRAAIIAQCKSLCGLNVRICRLGSEELRAAHEVFVCNSVLGIWPVTTIQWDKTQYSYEIGAVSRTLQKIHAQDEAK